jgi:flagellar assembly factor FliW
VLVRSERLGDLDVDDDKVLSFPDGLLGFPVDQRYVMVDIDGGDAYRWLQSVDDPTLAFLAVIPWHFFPDYEPDIDAVTEAELSLSDPGDAIVLCLISVREESEPAVTANLLGPLIINTTTRVGRQVVLADSGYPARAALVSA